jgi:hypothetical protein
MKFERTTQFDSDFTSLPREHQKQFRLTVAEFHAACEKYVSTHGSSPWPKRLRVRKMTSADRIWEMTWSFASPDGRATFEFVKREDEMRVLWRRIGNHSIYRNP